MAQESKPTPPNSVIILPGLSKDVIGAERQFTSSVQDPQSIKNYLHIRSQKPDLRLFFLSGLTLLLPFYLLFFSDDVLNAIPICCFFLLTSAVLFTINLTKVTNWGKELEKARQQITATENIPNPPVAQWPQVAGTLSIIGGFIIADYEGILFLFGGGIGLGFFLYYYVLVQRRNNAFDQLIDELV